MTKYLAPSPKLRATDQNGTPLSGGLVTLYEPGTTTPAVTYSDGAGTLNASPIVLDDSGECDLWLTPGLKYDIRITDSTGVLQGTATRISAPVSPSAYFYTLMNATTQEALFDIIVDAGGTITGNLDFHASFDFAAPVSIASATSTPIGAAASNSVSIFLGFSFNATIVTMPSTSNWTACAYSTISNRYCMTAFNATAGAYSSDGSSWTASTLPTTRNWSQVVADSAGGFLVGVQNNSNYAYGDGTTWTGAVITGTISICEPLANNGTNIFAISTAGNNEKAIYTAGGGAAWTQGNAPAGTPGTSNGFSSIAGYNTATTVTVAGRRAGGGNQSGVDTSNVGTSWDSVSILSGTFGRPMIGCNGSANTASTPRFVAVDGSGFSGNVVLYSDDGASWTSGTLPATATTGWTQPVWCGNVWVICSLATTTCLTSPDAVTWTSHTLPRSIPSSSLGYVYPASTNGSLYSTVIPCYNTAQAVLITTV